MMNQYPLWKYLLIIAVLVFGALYAAPNIYGEDPALQISQPNTSSIDSAVQNRIEDILKGSQMTFKAINQGVRDVRVRFHNTEDQLKAKDLLEDQLGDDYTVALNLAPATPQWLSDLGPKPMYLGLDLRGGIHFLLDVDMAAVVKQAEQRYVSDFRSILRSEKARYLGISRLANGGVQVKFRQAEALTKGMSAITKEYPNINLKDISTGDSHVLLATLKKSDIDEIKKQALKQNILTLRNRVNELGVAEPVIQQQGLDRIVVQLPGVQDSTKAKDILGATATLEFRMVDQKHNVQDAVTGKVPAGSRLYKERTGEPILLQKRVMLTGNSIIDAASGIEQETGTPAVFITLDGKGARQFYNATKDNIGKLMSVVFLETKRVTKVVDGKKVKVKVNTQEVINVATIQDALSKRFQITGLDSTEEARTLALLLRAGALSAPIDFAEERTVGPSLGQENIDQGLKSVVYGFALVMVFMVIFYKAFGLVANIALTLNLILVVALLSLMQATLTLPGIAGIVLTVGMAVDANVLIFERIREELKNGVSPQASIQAGYEKAFSTIADANITTLIAAIILYAFGTGPIKGFAITLSLGILTSMFTAIMGTRAVVNLMYGSRRRLEKLSI